MILAALIFLVAEAISKGGGVPELELRAVRQIEQPGGTGIVVEVYNHGHATAADISISGTAAGLSGPRHVTLDYAPAESVREVTLVFPQFVTHESIALEVLGYQDP